MFLVGLTHPQKKLCASHNNAKDNDPSKDTLEGRPGWNVISITVVDDGEGF